MAKRKPAKKKQAVTRYLFLILGGALILIVLFSWFAFPGWHAQPGGLWTLIGAAVIGLLAIAKDVVSIIKDVKEMNKPSQQPRETIHRQTQKALNSEGVEQSMEFATGSQEQIAENSKIIHQTMKKK